MIYLACIRLYTHISIACTIISIRLLYNLATVCLKWAFSCVDYIDVIMGDIPQKFYRPVMLVYWYSALKGYFSKIGIVFSTLVYETKRNLKKNLAFSG